ncbi:nucleoside monophosphate kinase [Streptomyces sp. cg36]|uniref:nucleoside monophosphate kinase n=1 Tax=Streptomyces sp. cg36 TaxID=3238798 RepID=UPI0034E25161
MKSVPAAVVVVLGPPASGKTSVAVALAACGAAVFRPREAARRLAQTEPIIAALLDPGRGPAGELPDLLAHDLARTAIDSAAGRPVVLEGYPRNAAQAELLKRCVRSRGRRLCVIELTARPGTLAARLARRRACPVCSAMPAGSPEPGGAASGPGRCADCDVPLVVRDTDRGEHAEQRFAHYAQHLAAIRAVLADGDPTAWHTLTTDPGSPDASTCVLDLLPAPAGNGRGL